MPSDSNGEKRSVDAIGLAVHIGRIATGEIEGERENLFITAAEMRREGWLASMMSERRAQITHEAAAKR